MSLKTKLLTSVAAMTLGGGAALAENTTANAEEMPKEEITQSEYAPGWNEDLDNTYRDIADRPVIDLVGMNVVTEAGDDVGEVDTFIIMENEIQAVVGVGGFLGLGEHDVALPLNELRYDGERLIIAYTEDELKSMPEYTEEMFDMALQDDDTFRTRRGEMEADHDMASTEADASMSEDEDSTAMEMADGDIEDVDEASAPTGEEVAAAEEPANDAATMTEKVAEAGKGEIEQEAEELAAEADAAATEAGQEIEETAEGTVDAIQEGTEEAKQMAENATAETEQVIESGAEKVAEVAEATENAVEEGADEVAQEVGETADDWKAILASFDVDPTNLIGTNVATATGEVIGEIDGVAHHNEKIVALVGIGGFLGLGEHDVALTFDSMSYDGEKFIADGYTEAELKEMPQYDEDSIERIDVSDVRVGSE